MIKMSASFAHDFPSETPIKPLNEKTFDENAKKDFLSGAKKSHTKQLYKFLLR